MGDLPKWKKWWSHYDGWPTQVENDGLIMMGDLPRKNDGGLIMIGDLPKWKMLVSLWWVTYPEKMMMVSLWWVTYPNERWMSHYDGWPTLMKGDVLIMMGDLPK